MEGKSTINRIISRIYEVDKGINYVRSWCTHRKQCHILRLDSCSEWSHCEAFREMHDVGQDSWWLTTCICLPVRPERDQKVLQNCQCIIPSVTRQCFAGLCCRDWVPGELLPNKGVLAHSSLIKHHVTECMWGLGGGRGGGVAVLRRMHSLSKARLSRTNSSGTLLSWGTSLDRCM